MKVQKLKRSIAVIIGLIILLMFYHIIDLFGMAQSWLAVAFILFILTINTVFFIQLRNNFKTFFFINRLTYPIYSIIISVSIAYLSTIGFIILGIERLYASSYFVPLRLYLFAIILICFVYMTMHYAILGYRLQKHKTFPLVQKLGLLYLFLIPLTAVVLLILRFSHTRNPYYHIFIITEIFPLLIIYKIYKDLIAKENKTENAFFITNAAVTPGEDEGNGLNKFTT